MEFMTIVTIMFFIFSVFSVIIINRIAEKKKEKSWIELKTLGEDLKLELDIASAVENGYHRTFWIPLRVDSKAYNVSILQEYGSNKSVLAIYFLNFSLSESYYLTVPANILGEILKGNNNLSKINGTICLNKC